MTENCSVPSACATNLTVINLFGPPGVGKSSLAATVFSAMKLRHESVGLVQEYAKDLLLRLPRAPNEDLVKVLASRQLHLFAEQHHRQQVLAGVYRYAVTDSPLLMSVVYAPRPYYPSFEALVKEVFDSYHNINFYLTRDWSSAPFEKEGRIHDLEQAMAADTAMRETLARLKVPYSEVDLDAPNALRRILDTVLSASAP